MNTVKIHTCSFSDPNDYFILVAGRKWRFDFSERFGPMPVTKAGNELAGHVPNKFYEAVTWWARQGKKVVDGLCVWEVPKDPTPFVMINTRNYVSPDIARKLGLTEEYIAKNTKTFDQKL